MTLMWYSCDSHWRILFRLQLVLDLKLRPAQTVQSPTAHIVLRLPVTCLRDQTSVQHGVLHNWTSHRDPSLLILCCVVTIPHLQLLRWECCMDTAGALTHRSLTALVQLKCSKLRQNSTPQCLPVKCTYQRTAEASGRGNNNVLCRKWQNNVCRPWCRRYRIWQKQ